MSAYVGLYSIKKIKLKVNKSNLDKVKSDK